MNRVVIRVEACFEDRYQVVVPAWGQEVIEIPRQLLPEELRAAGGACGALKRWDHFIASVNLGAESAEGLGFTDFERAPKPANINLENRAREKVQTLCAKLDALTSVEGSPENLSSLKVKAALLDEILDHPGLDPVCDFVMGHCDSDTAGHQFAEKLHHLCWERRKARGQ